MKFINGTSRNQLPLFSSSIDDAIAQDNEIRLIDLFVYSLKLPDFGFTFDFVENGRPVYHPSDLLKLFIYGYLNRMCSSKTLEKKCTKNSKGRLIERSQYADLIYQNKVRIENNYEIYRRRQASR
jgi:transposase